MICLGKQPIGGRHQRIGLSLQSGSAAPLDFCHALSQPSEEGVQLLAHLG